LNADGYIKTPSNSLLSTNMYTYCENNPVNKIDPTGDFAFTTTLGGIALWKMGVALIGAITALAMTYTIVKNTSSCPTISIPEIKI